MRSKSIPPVTAISLILLITATPIPVFGVAYYLDTGSYHIFDDDSHKCDEVFLDQGGYRDPGTKLEFITGCAVEVCAKAMTESSTGHNNPCYCADFRKGRLGKEKS